MFCHAYKDDQIAENKCATDSDRPCRANRTIEYTGDDRTDHPANVFKHTDGV